MKNKLYRWLFGVLCIFTIAGASYLFSIQYARIQKLKKANADTKTLLDKSTKELDELKNKMRKEQYSFYIDAIAHIPGLEEVYQLMTENPLPYSSEIKEEIFKAQLRFIETFSKAPGNDIMNLPKLPDDIDPDDIPPFTQTSHGATYYYNRPLTQKERDRYDLLKARRHLTKMTPAELKAEAIAHVRHGILASTRGFEYISWDIASDILVEGMPGDKALQRSLAYLNAFVQSTHGMNIAGTQTED